MFAIFNRFEIKMTLSQARSVSQSGKDAEEDVRALMRDPKIARQLRKIPIEDVRAELREYGAWDEAELANEDMCHVRILWIAGGNIAEENVQR